MKKLLLSVLPLMSLYGCQPDTPAQPLKSSPATAGAGTDDVAMRALAQKNLCLTCHTLDNTLVGPAWRKVATKYRGQKDAETRLVDKVAKGGTGVWGAMVMPPNAPRVSEEDIRTLVRYTLSLQ